MIILIVSVGLVVLTCVLASPFVYMYCKGLLPTMGSVLGLGEHKCIQPFWVHGA